jgi:hypothetical protein
MLEKYNPRYIIPTAIIAPYIIITCNVSVHITAFIPPCKIINNIVVEALFKNELALYTYNHSVEDAHEKNGSD